MRYAIISDIHGNLEALTAVLRGCEGCKVEALLCLGDIVGYGANPKECLNLIRVAKMPAVAGNHDWAVSGRLDASHFTEEGKAAIMWTRPQMDIEDIAYLNALPLSLKDRHMILAHGSLDNPERFRYLGGAVDTVATFEVMDRPVCFVGHTHVPAIFMQHNETVYQSQDTQAEVKPDCRYIVNVGSVGQPRDGNAMASFGIYDTAAGLIEIHRVPYDVAAAQDKIIRAGLPGYLAARLAAGE